MEKTVRVKPSVMKMQIENLQKDITRLTEENETLKAQLAASEGDYHKVNSDLNTILTVVKAVEGR